MAEAIKPDNVRSPQYLAANQNAIDQLIGARQVRRATALVAAAQLRQQSRRPQTSILHRRKVLHVLPSLIRPYMARCQCVSPDRPRRSFPLQA
jgi:hypothetical protein